MELNIALATDMNYFRFMETAAFSAIINKTSDSKLCFHILCDRITDIAKIEFQNICNKYNAEVKYYDVDVSTYIGLPEVAKHISHAAYLRLELAELLSSLDKVLYLDCDVLVCRDITNFFAIDIDGYDLAGVEDLGYRILRKEDPIAWPIEGFYVNSGVILMNLKRWREGRYKEKFLSFSVENSSKIVFGDQAIINLMCRGRILSCSQIYNVQAAFFGLKKSLPWYDEAFAVKHSINHPIIIHFTANFKPWNTFSIPAARCWLKMYKKLMKELSVEDDEILKLLHCWNLNFYKIFWRKVILLIKDVVRPERAEDHYLAYNCWSNALINQMRRKLKNSVCRRYNKS